MTELSGREKRALAAERRLATQLPSDTAVVRYTHTHTLYTAVIIKVQNARECLARFDILFSRSRLVPLYIMLSMQLSKPPPPPHHHHHHHHHHTHTQGWQVF